MSSASSSEGADGATGSEGAVAARRRRREREIIDATRRLFDERALGFFETHPGWVVEARANRLLVTRQVKHHPEKDWNEPWTSGSVRPEKVDLFLESALEIQDLLRR